MHNSIIMHNIFLYCDKCKFVCQVTKSAIQINVSNHRCLILVSKGHTHEKCVHQIQHFLMHVCAYFQEWIYSQSIVITRLQRAFMRDESNCNRCRH